MPWQPLPADIALDNAPEPAQPQSAQPTTQDSQTTPETPTAAPAASSGAFVPLPANVKLDHESPDLQAPTQTPAPPKPGDTVAIQAPPDVAKGLLQIWNDPNGTADQYASFAAQHGFSVSPDEAQQAFGHRKGHALGQEVPARAVAQPPQPKAPDESVSPLRQKVSDAVFDTIDNVLPGVGSVLRNHADSGRAYIENTADAAGGDYGPEIGGFLKTVASPSEYENFRQNLGDNINDERAILEHDSEGHPIASIAGQLTGAGLVAPVGGEALDAAGILKGGDTALNAGRAVLQDGGTMEEARAAAAAAGKANFLTGAGRATAGGAVYGAGSAGPGNRTEGAIIGAGLGATTHAIAPVLPIAIRAVGNTLERGPSASPEAITAANAASDLGVTLPKFALNDADRASAGSLEQTAFGRGPIVAGRTAMMDSSRAARDQIASDLGTAPETQGQLGDQIRNAAIAANKTRRAAASSLYDQAKSAAGNIAVPATQTKATLQQLIDSEGQGLGSKTAPILQSLSDQLDQKGGMLTIDGARDTRTNLRNLLTNEADATPTNADRITNAVMNSVQQDMNNGLTAAGRENAINIYKQADTAWAQNRELEDGVLKPFLGRDFGNDGDQVAAKINSAAKGLGGRLAAFLGSLPADAANNVRSSLIVGLGRTANGAQNAAGDAFSLNTFLTNWNQLSGSRKLIFAPQTVEALDKLASIAQVAKRAEATRNFSNTGRAISSALLGAEGGGSVIGFMTGHPHEAVAGALLTGLTAARQYGAAKLLASPAFAERLAKTPLNPQAASAFWSRPWVSVMAAKNPAIAGEIQLFQKAVNDNLRAQPVAASPDSNGPGQNQQSDNGQP